MSSRDLGTTGFAAHDETFPFQYRGQVMNNLDPLQAGRIQVQVLPMLAKVEADLLPWAIPAMPISSGAGNGTGSFLVPDIGSWVWIFFEMGSIYQPVYFAEAQDAVHGLPLDRTINYPYRRIIETPTVELYVDEVIHEIRLAHFQGVTSGGIGVTSGGIGVTTADAFFKIDETGNVYINGTNIIITTTGTTTWVGTGNVDITSSENISITGATVNINP